MILRTEALDLLEEAIKPTNQTETVALADATGRTLAQTVISDLDAPPFDRVCMDGYAVLSADGPGEYEVVEYIPAGAWPQTRLTPGKISRIMTGAPLPPGADAVVPVEDSGGYVAVGQKGTIIKQVSPGQHISPRGHDLPAGSRVLEPGTKITPGVAAIVAASGISRVAVYLNPSIAILSTGDELVAPDKLPKPGEIRNLNETIIRSHAAQMGLPTFSLGVASDNKTDLESKLTDGARYDFLLVSGGISAGDKDFVPTVLRSLGYEQKFHKVAIKPGKPVFFAVGEQGKKRRYVFGLPGNPVSTFVIFELFVKPALRRFMGGLFSEGMSFPAMLAQNYSRKHFDREEFVPAKLTRQKGQVLVHPLRYQGSGHIHAFATAKCLLCIPTGVSCLAAGDKVEIAILS